MTTYTDYLWDGSGQPDPDLERLERVLGALRFTRPAPEFPALVQPIRPSALRFWNYALAAAASIALVAAGTWYILRPGVPRAAWDLEVLQGTPTVETKKVAKANKLVVGQWLETDSTATVELSSSMVGTVVVEPNSRVKLVQAQEKNHRLEITRGTLHARIWAPPNQFFVQTPSALAADLGCKYTVHVDDDGSAHLSVEMGWVAFELGGREAFVLEGAMCSTRPGIGPGTPYYEDAPAALREAVQKLDFELVPIGGVPGGIPGGVAGGVSGGVAGGVSGGVAGGVQGGVPGGIEGLKQRRAAALGIVLREARPRDTLTLWHLLERALPEERGAVYDLLAKYSAPPSGVTREGIIGGNRDMRMDWWFQITGKPKKWWEMWTGKLPEKSN